MIRFGDLRHRCCGWKSLAAFMPNVRGSASRSPARSDTPLPLLKSLSRFSRSPATRAASPATAYAHACLMTHVQHDMRRHVDNDGALLRVVLDHELTPRLAA